MRTEILITAMGKWPSILLSIGCTEKQMSGKHAPCPMCEGKDRFRMIELDGKGKWICNQCGSGDGMNLACLVLNMPFKDAVEKIRPYIAGASYLTTPKKPDQYDIKQRTTKLMNTWRAAKDKEMVSDYLKSRGLPEKAFKGVDLRGSITDYYNEGRSSKQNTILARVCTPHKKVACLHKTYLFEDGTRKKKLSQTTREWSGGAIRLFKAEPEGLIVAEGIETALAARWLYYCKSKIWLPCWSTFSANGMAKLGTPKGLKHLLIFGDNDITFTGQYRAYELANRTVVRLQVPTEVFIPPKMGMDWLDVLNDLKGDTKCQ